MQSSRCHENESDAILVIGGLLIMSREIRIVHYINQFFAGIGGEDHAHVGVEVREGAIGPGKLIEQKFEQGRIVGTVICGDNYATENSLVAVEEILERIQGLKPDIVIAGPAFNAGRYGMACGMVCEAVNDRLSVPAVTAMYPENPGVELYGQKIYIVPTGGSAAAMSAVIEPLIKLASKLATGVALGPAETEGYIPQGYRKNVVVEKNAAERAVDMLLLKIKGEKFKSELPLPKLDRVAPPQPIADLTKATVALVTEGGIVPEGNPDHLEVGRAVRWIKYSLAGVQDLSGDSYDAIHGGYDGYYANEDPDRVLPVDVMRELESEGYIGKLHEYYYVTAGMASYVENCKRFGQEIGKELKEAGIDAVIATGT